MPQHIPDKAGRVMSAIEAAQAEDRHPTLAELARVTGMSRSTIKTTMRALEKLGSVKTTATLGGVPEYKVRR